MIRPSHLFNISFLVLIASCNKGGGSSATNSGAVSSTISSQFIDSPVKGLNLKGSVSGSSKTVAEGRFNCKTGEEVTFYLRNLEIGSTTCGKTAVYLDDVVSDVAKADKFASVLLSLSSTDTNSSIDLSKIPEEHDVKGAIDMSVDEATLLGKIRDLKVELGTTTFHPDPISLANARIHVNENIPPLDPGLELLLESYLSSPPTLVASLNTETGDSSGPCTASYSSQLVITKNNGKFSGKFVGVLDSFSITHGEIEKMILGSSLKIHQADDINLFLATAPFEGSPVGVVLGNGDSYKDGGLNETFVFFDQPISNVNNFFPVSYKGGTTVAINFSSINGITGSVDVAYGETYISDYIDPTHYTFNRKYKKCAYSISVVK